MDAPAEKILVFMNCVEHVLALFGREFFGICTASRRRPNLGVRTARTPLAVSGRCGGSVAINSKSLEEVLPVVWAVEAGVYHRPKHRPAACLVDPKYHVRRRSAGISFTLKEVDVRDELGCAFKSHDEGVAKGTLASAPN
eukprot:GHVT01076401.1.p2 GENE.GHVT01076401.1~~GHVT01076401.1.p2  ORF type:complete len:140 (-),score=15.39 GHVT01076401.1:462-881(-)